MCDCSRGACMAARGRGVGVMHGCSWGACMVAWRGHTWLLQGGWGRHAWLLWGGMHGCSGGHVWLLRGACMVALGGGAGMHGIRRDTEIRSMSGRYASYWNAFLFSIHSTDSAQQQPACLSFALHYAGGFWHPFGLLTSYLILHTGWIQMKLLHGKLFSSPAISWRWGCLHGDNFSLPVASGSNTTWIQFGFFTN